MKRPIPPYHAVAKHDLVVLKKAAGPVVGICQIGEIWDYRLSGGMIRGIRDQFADLLCAHDPTFWAVRETASYASLMRIERVQQLEPFSCEKRDRRGWVVLKSGLSQSSIGG